MFIFCLLMMYFHSSSRLTFFPPCFLLLYVFYCLHFSFLIFIYFFLSLLSLLSLLTLLLLFHYFSLSIFFLSLFFLLTPLDSFFPCLPPSLTSCLHLLPASMFFLHHFSLLLFLPSFLSSILRSTSPFCSSSVSPL